MLIDDSNWYYGFLRHQWELDYQKFYDWLNKEFDVIDIIFFGGIISRKAYFERHPSHTIDDFIKCQDDRRKFLEKLKAFGYKVKTKPVTSVYDSTTGDYKRKCNFDVEITIIAIDRMGEYEELVLCSGDGDFLKLVKYLKGKHKKVTIITHHDRLNYNLAQAANRSIFLHTIKSSVEKIRDCRSSPHSPINNRL